MPLRGWLVFRSRGGIIPAEVEGSVGLRSVGAVDAAERVPTEVGASGDILRARGGIKMKIRIKMR